MSLALIQLQVVVQMDLLLMIIQLNLLLLLFKITLTQAEQDSFTNNQVLTNLLKTKDSDGNDLLGLSSMVKGSPATLWGRRWEITQQVPSNLSKGNASGTCSAVIYGNWADLIVAQWDSPLDILVNHYGSSYAAGKVEIRAMSSLDIVLRHPESFAAMTTL